MRLILPLCLALVLTAACEAGNRGGPGASNLLAGPTVRITAPLPRQVVDGNPVAVKLHVTGATLTFDGSPGDTVLAALDGEVLFEVPDPAEAFEIPFRLTRGTHVLEAFCLDEEGRAWRNEKAADVRVFHVGAPSQRYTWRDETGERRPVDPARDPVLVWASPWGPVPASEPVRVEVLVRGRRLGEDHRLRVAAGATSVVSTAPEPVLLELPAGEHVVTAVLEERVEGEEEEGEEAAEATWRRVPGPLTLRERTVEVR